MLPLVPVIIVQGFDHGEILISGRLAYKLGRIGDRLFQEFGRLEFLLIEGVRIRGNEVVLARKGNQIGNLPDTVGDLERAVVIILMNAKRSAGEGLA